jgi:hypothetical protein
VHRSPFRSGSNPTNSSNATLVSSSTGMTKGSSGLSQTSSYDSRLVAMAMEGQALGGDDTWQGVCVRVLPLFNGEGHKGFIEGPSLLFTWLSAKYPILTRSIFHQTSTKWSRRSSVGLAHEQRG